MTRELRPITPQVAGGLTEEEISRVAAAARLRQLAAETGDEQERRRLLDTAAEWDGLSLNGAGNPRADG